jgi:hypothetical protein
VEGSGIRPEIGDIGPGGGTIFAVDGFSYKEVSAPLGKSSDGDASRKETAYRGGGFADWYMPYVDEMQQIYNALSKTKKVNFGDDNFWAVQEYYFFAQAERPRRPQEIPGFSGAFIYLAGGGGSTDYVRLSDGQVSAPGKGTGANLVLVRSVRDRSAKIYTKGATGPGGGIIFAMGPYGDSSYKEARVIGKAASFGEASAMARNYRGNGLSDWTLRDSLLDESLGIYIYNNNLPENVQAVFKDILFWRSDGNLNTLMGESPRKPEAGQSYDVLVVRRAYGFGASAGFLAERKVEEERLAAEKAAYDPSNK